MQEEARKRAQEERQAQEEARRRFIEETSKPYLSFPEIEAASSSAGGRRSASEAREALRRVGFSLMVLLTQYLFIFRRSLSLNGYAYTRRRKA